MTQRAARRIPDPGTSVLYRAGAGVRTGGGAVPQPPADSWPVRAPRTRAPVPGMLRPVTHSSDPPSAAGPGRADSGRGGRRGTPGSRAVAAPERGRQPGRNPAGAGLDGAVAQRVIAA